MLGAFYQTMQFAVGNLHRTLRVETDIITEMALLFIKPSIRCDAVEANDGRCLKCLAQVKRKVASRIQNTSSSSQYAKLAVELSGKTMNH